MTHINVCHDYYPFLHILTTNQKRDVSCAEDRTHTPTRAHTYTSFDTHVSKERDT